MRLSITIATMWIPAMLLAGSRDDDGTNTLIKKLGSANFQDRALATKLLQERPEAEPALRKALRSSDPEIAKRSAAILDYFPLRELNLAVKQGRITDFVKLISSWPSEKYEHESWGAVQKLSHALTELHHKQGGAEVKLRIANPPHNVLTAESITDATEGRHDRHYFLRAGEVELNIQRPGTVRKNWFVDNSDIVSVGGVRIRDTTPNGRVIFAGGSIELNDGGGQGISNVLIVSDGDVTLDCVLDSSLVIARGKITCTGVMENCRIISGKSVTYKRAPRNCQITENETNPLGFIRWTDAAKSKAEPKVK
jgi:hypothetical protein